MKNVITKRYHPIKNNKILIHANAVILILNDTNYLAKRLTIKDTLQVMSNPAVVHCWIAI
jgi:hypothetical protein